MVRPYQPADLPVVMDIGNRAWQPIFDNVRAAARGGALPGAYRNDACRGRQG